MAGMDDVPREILQAAYKRKPIYLLKIPFQFAMWGGIVALLWAMREHPYRIAIGLVCSFFVTNIIRGLGAIAHDAVHGTVTKNKTLAYWISLLCWSPTGMSVTIYQNYHLHHHRIANTYPDVDNFVVTDYTRNPVLAKMLLMAVYTFGYPIYFMFQMLRYTKRLTRWQFIRMHLELAGIFTLVGIGIAYGNTYVFMFAYGLPFIAGAMLASITSMIEHYEMEPGEDAYSSRTYAIKYRFMNFLWNNVSFHNEHHKFPGIPWYNLRSFHEAAYPYYDERVKRDSCHDSFFGIMFECWGRILKLDIDKLDKKYAQIDRAKDRAEHMALPGIQSDAV